MRNDFRYGLVRLVALALLVVCCAKEESGPSAPVTHFFVKGADMSWLTEMEGAGVKFFDDNGNQKDCMAILKERGINTIRLRAWVHPVGGWNGNADVVTKAKRARALGMRIMIALHLSDTWADPGHQTKPASWASLSVADLRTRVFNYTKGLMDTLRLNDATPSYVQIGNETNDGMLWPEGKVSSNGNNFTNMAAFITQGYNAVKAVSDTTKVIVHISNGHDSALFRWMFDGLANNGAVFDIIGMSLYPSFTPGGAANWSFVNTQCLNNMNDMVVRYNKPVMLVEVGMPQNDAEASKMFLSDLIVKTKSVSAGKGLGVMYWEPECYNNWKGYGLGAFDSSGKPTVALDAFVFN